MQKKNWFNVVAGCMLLLHAALDVINEIKAIQIISQYSKMGFSLGWQLWMTVIANGAVVVLFGMAGLFLLQEKDDFYAKAITAAGAIILSDYIIAVSYLFKTIGSLAWRVLIGWRYILIYGAMACFGLCYILSGNYARKVDENPSASANTKWLQAPLTYVVGIVCILIASSGLGQSPLNLLSTTPTEGWIQVLGLVMDFLVLLFVGLYFRRQEQDFYLSGARTQEMNGVPPFNNNSYQTDSGQHPYGAGLGFGAAAGYAAQQGYGPGAAYGGQQGYGAQGYGPGAAYGGQQGYGPGAAYGGRQSYGETGGQRGFEAGPVYGIRPDGQAYGQETDMPQKPDLSKGIDMPQKPDLSKGIDMPQKPDLSKGIDMPQQSDLPERIDIPEGNFDELLGYGRQNGYGQQQVDLTENR
ncbi:MAG: hypothetical protein IKQ49_01620 [Eubacterium sp.]|nr:hypothetical protein [Eubacterium sp.]